MTPASRLPIEPDDLSLIHILFHLLLKGFRQCDHIRLSPFILKFVCNCLCAVSLCNQIQFFVEPF